MNPYVGYGILGSSAYLLGAIPFGLLLSRLKGVDVRTVGSKNIGATNVFRSVSKPLGITTFLLDALKGLTPSYAFPLLWKAMVGTAPSCNAGLYFGILAIVGHNWPVYLKFRGGKGVATSAGALIGVTPYAILIGFVTWTVALLVTRYVSVASMLASLAVVCVGWIRYSHDTRVVPWALTALGLAIIYRHRANIQRLLKGEEHRFSFRKRNP